MLKKVFAILSTLFFSVIASADVDIAELRQKAESGNAQAQSLLGAYYAKGIGVPEDPVEAVKWFRKAAAQGEPTAQYNLGLCCYQGRQHENLCAISSTSWNELLFGINIMPSCKRRDFYFDSLVDDIQSRYNIIQYDNHAAWLQADIRSRLKENGTPVEFDDTQIASIAISNNMILVTRNTKHFEPIQKVSPLMLENWFEE